MSSYALGEMETLSAAGGTALTTTPAVIQFPPGTRRIDWEISKAGANLAQVGLSPRCIHLVTADLLATAPTDYSDKAQDASTSTLVVFDSLDTIANLDAWYVGFPTATAIGLVMAMTNGNDTASVLSAKYWNGSSWAAASITDGTDVSGDTMKQSGNITWAEKTDWAASTLLGNASTTINFPTAGLNAYWMRFEVTVALDTEVEFNAISAITSKVAEYGSGRIGEQDVRTGSFGALTGLEVEMQAGTGTIVVNGYPTGDGSRWL